MTLPKDFAARLLNDLRPREREVLGLHFFNDFDPSDIGHLLGMNPDSASSHLTRGTQAVARILERAPDEARALLRAFGEIRAQALPPFTLRWRTGSVTLAPSRSIIASAVREDEHQEMDVTRYFVTAIDEKSVTPADVERWYLKRSTQLGLVIKRELLARKALKSRERFDVESLGYFFPVGYGTPELYFERDFEHRATRVVPAQRSFRSIWLADLWNVRVLDLGEYKARYEDDLALEIEAIQRRTITSS